MLSSVSLEEIGRGGFTFEPSAFNKREYVQNAITGAQTAAEINRTIAAEREGPAGATQAGGDVSGARQEEASGTLAEHTDPYLNNAVCGP
jgi:hypothetical protein